MVQEGKLSEDDKRTFFLALKKGDIDTVRNYVESRRASPNTKDSTGSSALYWACLCDQPDIVSYLLKNGAEYDSSSPEGERSFLAAQNPDIRKLLKATEPEDTNNKKGKGKGNGKGGNKQRYAKNGMRFEDFLSRLSLLHRSTADVPVITTGADGQRETVQAHSFILQARARNAYLTDKLETGPRGDKTIYVEAWSSATFGYVLHFLYTGDMECSLSTVEETIKILRTLGYDHLADDISTTSATNNRRGSDVLCIKKDNNRKELQNDLCQLALKGMPISIANRLKSVPSYDKDTDTLFADITFRVKGIDFNLHRVFFEDRCDSFRNMFAQYINKETESNGTIPVITIRDVSPETFGQLVLYFYTDGIHVTRDVARDLLAASDKFKVHLLTQRISQKMASLLNCQNVSQFYRTAKESNMKKVAEACIHFMSANLDQMMSLNPVLFTKFVLEFSDDDYNVSSEIAASLSQSYEKEQVSERDARDRLEKLNDILIKLNLEPVAIKFKEIRDRNEASFGGALGLEEEPETSPRKHNTTVVRVNLRPVNNIENWRYKDRYWSGHRYNENLQREPRQTYPGDMPRRVEVTSNKGCAGSRTCVVQ